MGEKSQKYTAHCQCCSSQEGFYSQQRCQLLKRIDGLFSGKPILTAIFVTPLAFFGAAADYIFFTTIKVPSAQSSQVQEASLKSSDDLGPSSLPQVWEDSKLSGHNYDKIAAEALTFLYKVINLTAAFVLVCLNCLTDETSGTYRVTCALLMATSAAEFGRYLAVSGLC